MYAAQANVCSTRVCVALGCARLCVQDMTRANVIKGSCEQLMDEFILVPLFQNESPCENEFCRCKSYEWFRIFRLVLTQRQNAT